MDVFNDNELNELCKNLYDYKEKNDLNTTNFIYTSEQLSFAIRISNHVFELYIKRKQNIQQTRNKVHILVDQLENNDLFILEKELKYKYTE